jgi:hypothetical protein
MTNEALATALVQVEDSEHSIRADWERAARVNDVEERDAILKVLREAIAFKRALERWIMVRQRRTAQR